MAELEENNMVASLLEDNNILNIQDGEISGKREKRSPGKGRSSKKESKKCKKGKAGRRCRNNNH